LKRVRHFEFFAITMDKSKVLQNDLQQKTKLSVILDFSTISKNGKVVQNGRNRLSATGERGKTLQIQWHHLFRHFELFPKLL
jgi:hypothetical protein